jgi:precorrin-3B synthase
MVQLVGHLGDEAIFEAAGFALERLRPHVARTTPVKLGFQSCGEMKYLALGVPFGRLTSRMMRTLAGLAELNGSGELRMTPWRSVLLPGIAAGDPDKVFAQFGREFIVDSDDPLLRVASCPGSPACKNGSTRTQEDARALALLAKNLTTSGTGLHVSGCRKGCARAAASDVTLVGRDGRYDVVLSGRAGDDPSQYGLTFEQVREYLGTMNAAKDGACEKVAL